MARQERNGSNPGSRLAPLPTYRCLRVFAFDPQASRQLDTAIINDAVIQLPWEKPWEDQVTLGPANEYLEVVDYDPASSCFYPPLDLNDPMLLAQNGLPPSDGNPQFHQQMAFAVAMRTVRTFENALGRHVFWMREANQAPADGAADPAAPRDHPAFVRRLRIYPHAMREANAYYSPNKTALLFGYFRGDPGRDATGGEWVFTCLSQDIVAHETTHAILHGLRRRSVEPSNVDSLAFHEAFADVVALLQHFSSGAVIEHQLARSGGSLRSVSLLTGLAQQFGRGTGRGGPLRFALKMLIDEEKKLANNETIEPDRNAKLTEPHRRGQILVAAIFDAFVTIFERRTDDLFRMAGCKRGTTDPLPKELVTRLADEAEKAADHVLRMCIRALDYLPPADSTFGEYLRAIVTADADLVPADSLHYRTAFAESFVKRGIRIEGQVFTSTETLYWDPPDKIGDERKASSAVSASVADCSFWDVLSKLHLGIMYGTLATGAEQHKDAEPQSVDLLETRIRAIDDSIQNQAFPGVKGYTAGFKDLGVKRNLRDLAMMIVQANQAIMHEWLDDDSDGGTYDREWEELLGIKFAFPTDPRDPPLRSIRVNRKGEPAFEVPGVRISRRQAPSGDILPQLLVQVVQTRRAYFDPAVQKLADTGELATDDPRYRNPDFKFRGGATLIVDLRDGRVQRVIRKRIDDDKRLDRARAFRLGDASGLGFERDASSTRAEPFAFLHREAAQ